MKKKVLVASINGIPAEKNLKLCNIINFMH